MGERVSAMCVAIAAALLSVDRLVVEMAGTAGEQRKILSTTFCGLWTEREPGWRPEK